MHHSASQRAGDNILSWRPDRGKRVLVHPNSDGLGDRFSKTSSKMHPGAESAVWARMRRSCGPRTPNLAPFSLSIRESLSRPSANEGEKNSHRSPALPRHSTSLHRGTMKLSGFHSTSTIRKSGELEPNSLIARRGVGVGLPTPPDFHSGGPRIFSSTLCTTVWENTRRGAKNPPALHFAPSILGGAGDALLWPQKISSTTGGQRSCPARAFRRLHILEAEIFSIVSVWRGKIIPGLITSRVSSPSSPFSMTRRSVTKCNKLDNIAQNVAKHHGRAFPSRSTTPLVIMGGPR